MSTHNISTVFYFLTYFKRILDKLSYRLEVISALMVRESYTRYGRDNIGVLWLAAEPLLFTLAVILLWSTIKATKGDVPIVAFILTGYAPLTMWRHAISRSINCFQANSALLYHRQIGVLDIMSARILLEVYGAVIAFIAIAYIFYLFGVYLPPKDYALFYLGWFYMILFSGGLALIIACLSESNDWVDKIISPSTYIMVPLSGAFYLADWLPEAAREVALYLPSLQAYELIRGGQFGDSIRVYYDLEYLTFSCLTLIAIGLALTTTVRKHIVIE